MLQTGNLRVNLTGHFRQPTWQQERNVKTVNPMNGGRGEERA